MYAIHVADYSLYTKFQDFKLHFNFQVIIKITGTKPLYVMLGLRVLFDFLRMSKM